ncbi:hypothetical protein LWI29_037861 [Acer saccharum]|uniref:Uncharacterized protein n=1 Tax=Acer saccharum TaxID=4024 RepID=A0AA39SI43_ACESA|nr:hypothetical protein LWI29_037861 [Acer saccharum]
MKSAPLDDATIFTVLAILRSMSEPVKWIPKAFSMLIEMKISMNHLNVFLLDDELSNKESKSLEHSSDICAEIKRNFSWEPKLAVPTLRDISLEVKSRQKIVVYGHRFFQIKEVGDDDEICSNNGNLPKATKTFWSCKEKALNWKDCKLCCSQCLLNDRINVLVSSGMESFDATFSYYWCSFQGGRSQCNLWFVLVLIIGFLNIHFAKTYNKCQSLFKVAQGERLRAMFDVLNNMKIIKL